MGKRLDGREISAEMRAEMMEMMRNCNEMMKKKQEQMSQSEDG